MCGIAGFITNGAIPSEAHLQSMAARLRHRGPDGTRTKIIDRVGVVHTRLSIIDLEGGWQPLHDAGERYWLVANGEIYNYVELTAQLKQRGCNFLTHSDSETILHAYAVHGDDFLPHLNGMFAFALYDARDKRLLLARDRLGIKPLYYVELPDRIAFASEIKALLPLLPKPEINTQALLQFLLHQFSIGEQTIVSGIKRVPLGTVLSIDADLRVRQRCYWSALDVTPRELTLEAAIEEFDGLMEQVMREHIRSDVPYGLFLSGGVDSGILAAMLQRYQKQPLRTFTMGFKGARMQDEVEPAQRIATQFNTRHSVVELDQETLWRRLPHMVWACDELMRDYACLPTGSLAEAAGKELKVVFSGEGGDEVFAGYRRYKVPLVERWAKALIKPGSGGFRTGNQWRSSWSRQLFGPELTAALAEADTAFGDIWRVAPSGWGHLRRCQYTDLVTALPDDLLVKADRMLMAFGVEGRVPFLDHRVVEFGLSLPDRLKVRNGEGKWFLKRWAERVLPRDHLARAKSGFHVPVGEWLRGERLTRVLAGLHKSEAIGRWFKPEGLTWLVERQQQRGDVGRAVWSLLQISIWHQLFVEGGDGAPSSLNGDLFE
jgi:asparagine synthase (glutamine-hydrolysing)